MCGILEQDGIGHVLPCIVLHKPHYTAPGKHLYKMLGSNGIMSCIRRRSRVQSMSSHTWPWS